jgi:hypothetical protein
MGEEGGGGLREKDRACFDGIIPVRVFCSKNLQLAVSLVHKTVYTGLFLSFSISCVCLCVSADNSSSKDNGSHLADDIFTRMRNMQQQQGGGGGGGGASSGAAIEKKVKPRSLNASSKPATTAAAGSKSAAANAKASQKRETQIWVCELSVVRLSLINNKLKMMADVS